MKRLTLLSLLVTVAFNLSLALAAPAPGALTPAEAHSAVSAESALLVDARSPEEFNSGHIDGALNVRHDQVAQHLAQFGTDKSRKIVVYCKSGRRAGLARETLIKNGYTNVWNAGGYQELAAGWDSNKTSTTQNTDNY